MYRKFLPWYIDKAKIHSKDPKNIANSDKYITVLNWNVHKNNHNYKWLGEFKEILSTFSPNFITFQEYQKINYKSIIDKDDDYGYSFFPNISLQENQYGLLMASKFKMISYKSIFTKKLEPIIKTPKVSFVCSYKLLNGKKLTLINVHMINFVKLKHFLAQLEQIKEVADSLDNALILCGDFNTWSNKRMKYLLKLVSKLGLKQVTFRDDLHKKKPFKYPLDHLFYKGLEVNMSEVLDKYKSSDHKPMLVRFKLI